MAAFEIRLKGCDETNQFVVDLTEAGADAARRIAAASQESSNYSCEPVMTITAAAEGAQAS
jgi:hypothetical protein